MVFTLPDKEHLMVIVESFGLTDIGRKRAHNEDTIYIDDKLGLYIVADGMGGHRAGEVASDLVVRSILDWMRTEAQFSVAQAQGSSSSNPPSPESKKLLLAIREANKRIHRLSQKDETCQGMGTTVSVVYLSESTFIVANVGDSPIYMIRDGSIELVSVMHNVESENLELHPDWAEQVGIQLGHLLTRAIGIYESVDADLSERTCRKGDIFVLCSDGLSDRVEPQEVLEISSRHSARDTCRFLVNLANERGGNDNISIIVLKVKKVKTRKERIFGFFPRMMGLL